MAAGSVFRRDRGGLNLESSLLVALLVLTASFTLFSLGDAIRCLYQREASMAGRIGFWAAAPGVSVSTESTGTVSWSVEGTPEGTRYTVLRARPGTEGLDMEDHATWANLGTYDAPPATGLDVQDGDYVVIALDIERCGYKLVGPAWPTAPPPLGDGGAWHAASFEAADDAAGTNARHWLAAYSSSGTQLWAIPSDLGEQGPAVPSRVGVSDDNLYAFLRPMVDLGSGPELGEGGIYALAGWQDPSPGEIRALVPPAVLDEGDPENPADDIAYDLDLDSFHVSSDGFQMLLTGVRDTDGQRRLLSLDLETKRPLDTGIAAGPLTTGILGRDGKAYGLDASGTLWELRRASAGGNRQVASGLPSGYVLESAGTDGTCFLYDATAGDGRILSVSAAGAVTTAGTTGEGTNFRASAADRDGIPAVLDGSRTARLDALRLVPEATGTNVKDTLLEDATDAGPVVEGLSLASVQGPSVNLGDPSGPPPPPPPPPAGDNTFTYEILVNGTVVYAESFVPADPDSVVLNDIVPADDRPYFSREENGQWTLPLVRAATHRTAALSGYGRSDYAEINAPGGLPGSVSSMSTPYSNLGGVERPGSWLTFWSRLTPDGEGPSPDDPSDGWAGVHDVLPGIWAQSIEHGAGHAIALGKDGSTLANSLCVSLPSLAESRDTELGGFGSRTYWMKGAATLAASGEENPSRLLYLVYPMLPSGTSYAVPDLYAGQRMADMAFQAAGVSWDEGAGRIPDSYLSYFGSEPSFPVAAAGNEGLLMMDTGAPGVHTDDTVLSRATRMKHTSIEVRISTPDGHPVLPLTAAKGNTLPNATANVSWTNVPTSSSVSLIAHLSVFDAEGDTVTHRVALTASEARPSTGWVNPQNASHVAVGSSASPYAPLHYETALAPGTTRYLHTRVTDAAHPGVYSYGVTPVVLPANNAPTGVVTLATTYRPDASSTQLDFALDIADAEGDLVYAQWEFTASSVPPATIAGDFRALPGGDTVPNSVSSPYPTLYARTYQPPGTTYYLHVRMSDPKGGVTFLTVPVTLPANNAPTGTVTVSLTPRPDASSTQVDFLLDAADLDGDRLLPNYAFTASPTPPASISEDWRLASYSGTTLTGYISSPYPTLYARTYQPPGTTYYLHVRILDSKSAATFLTVPVTLPANNAPTGTVTVSTYTNYNTGGTPTSRTSDFTLTLSDADGDDLAPHYAFTTSPTPPANFTEYWWLDGMLIKSYISSPYPTPYLRKGHDLTTTYYLHVRIRDSKSAVTILTVPVP